ncbi:MAG TPA: calcium-binding protein [Tepidisphaeraceae bacterium]|jgi:Ca2+-binding RTX toxin-like protein|nr:calcium-binding protein [Tepidisphaeraceae bacterium]
MGQLTFLSFETLETRRLFTVDLAVSDVQITSYDQANGLLNYSITVQNNGVSAAPPASVGEIFLSIDRDANDNHQIQLTQFLQSGMAAFSQNTFQGSLRIPGTTAAGLYFLGATADINRQVVEVTRSNNSSFSNSTLSVPQMFDLSFDGTEGNDGMTIRPFMSDSVHVDVNFIDTIYPLARIKSLAFNGLGGDDRMQIDPSIDLPVYMNGGDGKDVLVGGAGDDTLTGGGGKDRIYGGGGNDRLNGNGGADLLFGENGLDRLFGNAGADYLDGGSSRDRLDGGPGRDTVFGQGGNDIITANDGEIDSLFGGSGDDTAIADANDVKTSILQSI